MNNTQLKLFPVNFILHLSALKKNTIPDYVLRDIKKENWDMLL